MGLTFCKKYFYLMNYSKITAEDFRKRMMDIDPTYDYSEIDYKNNSVSSPEQNLENYNLEDPWFIDFKKAYFKAWRKMKSEQ